MPSISQNDEDMLLSSVQKVASLVDEGLSPDDAVEKVARDGQLAPGAISVLCHGFNTGRQLHQMRENTETLKKYASFELANSSKVISRIYSKPEVKEASVNLEQLMAKRREQLNPDSRQKLAQAPLPVWCEKKAEAPAEKKPSRLDQLREFELSKRAYDESRLDICHHENKMQGLFSKFADQMFGKNFAEVETVCRSRFGPLVTPVFDYLAALPVFERCKRANDQQVIKAAVSFQQAPYSTVAAIVEASQGLANAKNQSQACKIACDQAADQLRIPRVTPQAQKAASSKEVSGNVKNDEVGLLFRKRAFLGYPAVGMAMGNGVGKMLGDYPKTKNDMIDDEIRKLDDPEHLNEMRKIRASAMLNSMITDPEDPISGFDPDEVVGAYNEISRLAPNSSEQPAVIRPLLQRRLQGNVQPFEAKEITDIEKGITAARSPSRSILENVAG